MAAEPYPISRIWWVFVTAGVLNVIVGIIAIAHPGFTVTALGILLGIGLIVGALVTFATAVTGGGDGRVLGVILGLVSLLVGLICLRHPENSLLLLVVALGIYLVLFGVLRVIVAIAGPAPRGRALVVGGLEVVFGIVVLAWPDISLGTLAILLGIALVIRGVSDILGGLAIRHLQDTEARPAPAGPGFAT